MAELPAIPLWTDAYLADTGHLTTLEHGAYLLLLMTMWRNGGSLPNDDKKLARFARLTHCQWMRIKPTMMDFFQESSSSITQGRLTDELDFVRGKSKTQSDNARSRHRKQAADRQESTKLSNSKASCCQTEIEKLSYGSKPKHLKNKETGSAMGVPKDDLAVPNRCQLAAPTPTPISKSSDTNVSAPAVPAKPIDHRTRLFQDGLASLTRQTGRLESKLRPQLGKLLKALDDDARTLCDLIFTAENDRMADPIAWLEKSVQCRTARSTANQPKTFGEMKSDNFNEGMRRSLEGRSNGQADFDQTGDHAPQGALPDRSQCGGLADRHR